MRAGLNTCTGRAHTQRESGHLDGTCRTFFLCSKSAATPLPPFAFITMFLSMLPRDLEEGPTSLPLPLLLVFDEYILFCFFVLILGHCQCFLGTKTALRHSIRFKITVIRCAPSVCPAHVILCCLRPHQGGSGPGIHSLAAVCTPSVPEKGR